MDRYVPLLREFAARVVLFHESVAAVLGLHATDVKVLRILGSESMTAGQIAENTGLTGPAVTAVVDRLLEAGYVTRERDEGDRRRVTVRAVPAKIRALNKVYDAYAVDMAELLGHYSAAEFAAIERYMTQATGLIVEHTARLRARAKG